MQWGAAVLQESQVCGAFQERPAQTHFASSLELRAMVEQQSTRVRVALARGRMQWRGIVLRGRKNTRGFVVDQRLKQRAKAAYFVLALYIGARVEEQGTCGVRTL